MQRRVFLSTLVGGTLLFAGEHFGCSSLSRKKDPSRFLANNSPLVLLPQVDGGTILIWDWKLNQAREVKVPMPHLHSAIHAPGQNEVYLFEKLGKSICRFDWKLGKILHQYSLPERAAYFYGHGVVSQANNCLFATQLRYEGSERRGFVSVHNPEDLSLINTIPTRGNRAHDIHLLADGKLIVSNAEFLSIYDTSTCRELMSMTVGNGEDFIDHFQVINEAEILASGSQYHGVSDPELDRLLQNLGSVSELTLSTMLIKNREASIPQPSPMFWVNVNSRDIIELKWTPAGEPLLGSFSVQRMSEDTALSTHPNSELIKFWTGQKNTATLRTPGFMPLSAVLSPNGEELLVSGDKGIRFYRWDNFAEKEAKRFATVSHCSHIMQT